MRSDEAEGMQPTERFSSRVENYIKYRPHYPEEVIRILREECGLLTEWIIADIGSGTGISAELFLGNGNRVFGVEPNNEMREAAERLLAGCPDFTSVNGTAEATTLPDSSVDMIVAGQAFHWFDRMKAKQEFMRILKPGGWVALLWNDRKRDSPFLQELERVLQEYGTDYAEVNHRRVHDKDFDEFFSPFGYRLRTCANLQLRDLEAVRGGTLSASYAPEPSHTNYEPMMAELTRLFVRYQQNGVVRMEYETQVYFGRIF